MVSHFFSQGSTTLGAAAQERHATQEGRRARRFLPAEAKSWGSGWGWGDGGCIGERREFWVVRGRVSALAGKVPGPLSA
jgi:hypothetical protein